jgi:chromosome segregation ATPase|tara:strand:+ start:1406 stop:1579 length:174 start_codon:yes stop_codon:yes gene_type:complete
VQLNVNNPHFLIMQGRITKVLNMKPPEILGMLEEAAGCVLQSHHAMSSVCIRPRHRV